MNTTTVNRLSSAASDIRNTAPSSDARSAASDIRNTAPSSDARSAASDIRSAAPSSDARSAAPVTQLPRLRRLPIPERAPRPALRVVRDDDDGVPPTQGVLALALPGAHPADDFDAPQPTPGHELPEPRRWAAAVRPGRDRGRRAGFGPRASWSAGPRTMSAAGWRAGRAWHAPPSAPRSGTRPGNPRRRSCAPSACSRPRRCRRGVRRGG